uniref:Uncharacterized protein n=1 Tax=Anopheles minimus TaxID=112268 RepID=A0A182WNN7_9DIPT
MHRGTVWRCPPIRTHASVFAVPLNICTAVVYDRPCWIVAKESRSRALTSIFKLDSKESVASLTSTSACPFASMLVLSVLAGSVLPLLSISRPLASSSLPS